MTYEEARQAKFFFVKTNWIAPDKNASKFTKNIYEWLGFLTKELNRVEEVVTKEFKIVEEAIVDLRREKDTLQNENEQLKKEMKHNNESLRKEFKIVDETILDLRRERDALRSENEQLKKAMKQNNEGLSFASKLAINQPGKNSSVEKIAVLNTVTQELSEQKRRERKIVLTGV
jgi:predicted RNase H-like nuclease (RuvC/YqgF family)